MEQKRSLFLPQRVMHFPFFLKVEKDSSLLFLKEVVGAGCQLTYKNDYYSEHFAHFALELKDTKADDEQNIFRKYTPPPSFNLTSQWCWVMVILAYGSHIGMLFACLFDGQ